MRNATPSKIDGLFNKPQAPKALQFPKIAQKFHGKSGQIWDDWQKTFEAKARYVEPEFRVSNLLEQLADPVRKSVEVHFEALGHDDTSQLNYNDICDYIRSEFQKEDVVNDILIQYKRLQQGDKTI